uniref:Uncharacterized mitochondrial protein AtMg00860-like n=1 Tax=Nicotiana tabacum TaxID=4097 RepID=A0A1S4B4T9_TOBAC|nr:PREDICTED: uncharacterized mitochondrial protein AtMg00860-like [Nicotiana tabacum]
MDKCEFASCEIKFLGHLVSENQVHMEPKKVQAIVDWQAPSGVKKLRSFFGLANYYRKFIAGYLKRATPLTDLLKRNVKWVWSDSCGKAFYALKKAIASEPILKLPDFDLPFKLHTDASDYTVGGVLVQEDHPVHKPGRENQVVDALSRKEVFPASYALTRIESDFLDTIKLCAVNNP